MDKHILMDYEDACKLIRETERDIKRLNKKRKTVIQDKVRGSNPEFPYQPQSFQIQGIESMYEEDSRLRWEKKLLERRKENAERIKQQVEEWMLTIPTRMQRIIRFKFFERMTWEEVAMELGGKTTEEAVKKEFQRFLEK